MQGRRVLVLGVCCSIHPGLQLGRGMCSCPQLLAPFPARRFYIPACDRGRGCTASQQVEVPPRPAVRFIRRICVDLENMTKGRDIECVQAERFRVPVFQFCPLLFFLCHENSWSLQHLGAGLQPQTYLC